MSEKEFYRDEIMQMINEVEDVDEIKYFYTFIKLKKSAGGTQNDR